MATLNVERVALSPEWMLGLPEVVRMEQISDYMGRALTAAAADIGRAGAIPAGPALALYRGTVADTADVTAGFPVAAPVPTSRGTEVVALPTGEAIEAVHVGPYDTLGQTYEHLMAYFAEQNLTPASVMWEQYVVGPDTEPDPQKWRTRIVVPLHRDEP
ncbi:MAG: GyrI-like domain-containing protein [Cryobacterium sp.]